MLDIETAPNVGYTWGKWEQNVIEFIENWYILSFAYKWQGGKTRCVALPDFKGYRPGRSNDAKLLKSLWKLLNKADVVVAQNGDQFDIKKINTRFIHHRISPPSPYRTIDTLKIARARFGFNSNKLNDLGRDLGVGEKIKHHGFDLWKGCMHGDKKSWALMKKYNKQDVELLDKIYQRFRPWHKTHPNFIEHDKRDSCPACGSGNLQSRGTIMNQTMRYKRYACTNCGKWCRAVRGERIAVVTNA